MLQSSEYCFGKRSDQNYIRDGMVVPMVSWVESMKQYKNSEKFKKELKYIKKQNKILYSISKKSGSRHEQKNIKNIKDKAPKKRCNDSSNSSRDEYYSDYSLSSDSD